MLELNRGHPKFSMTMEILATLPRYPQAVPVSTLVEDFGMSTQDQVTIHLDRLKVSGRRLWRHNDTSPDKHGRMVAIMPDDWIACQAIAANYWDDVNR